MKKLGVLIVFFLLCAICTGYVLYFYKKSPVYPEVKHAVMYADTSSFPTFLQMVDFVKSDPSIPKLVFWGRMTHFTYQDSLPKHTWLVKGASSLKMKKNLKRLRKEIVRFLAQYPNAKLTLHLNKDQNALVWLFLTTIPREKIEHIHWYEESFGATSFQIGYIQLPKEYALSILNRKNPPPHFGINYALSLIPFYPSTIHIGMKDFVFAHYPEIKKLFTQAQSVEDVNYLKISQSLTEQQKKDLLRLAGINEQDLLPFHDGKPVMLYTLGFFADDKKFNKAQIRIMDRLLSGNIVPLEKPEQYTWFFKEHPWLTKNTYLKDTLHKKWPFMHALPKQIPLEILFLTGYMPDKVFGYSSSLFFALPPERILFYIQRPHDVYIPLLKQAGILTDDKIISLEEKNVSK